jgi:ankyrin repeat protein
MGNIRIVKFLVSEGALVNERTKLYGYTPINLAIQKGHIKVVKFLLKIGVKVNKHGDESIITAILNGQIEITKLLILNNAFMDFNTCFEIALERGHILIAMLLLERHSQIPLHVLINKRCNGDIIMTSKYDDLMKFLIEDGKHINKQDNEGKTPLFISVVKRDIYLIKLLIENNANMNIPSNGNSPLHVAIFRKYTEIVELLIENEVHINHTLYPQAKNIIDKFTAKIWDKNTHFSYPKIVRKRIISVMKLAKKNTQLSRLPKEILLLVLESVAKFSYTHHQMD